MATKNETSFELNGVLFTVESITGFGNTIAQFAIKAKEKGANKEYQTVEIFDVKNVSGLKHISPNIKKVTRLDKPNQPDAFDDDDIVSKSIDNKK